MTTKKKTNKQKNKQTKYKSKKRISKKINRMSGGFDINNVEIKLFDGENILDDQEVIFANCLRHIGLDDHLFGVYYIKKNTPNFKENTYFNFLIQDDKPFQYLYIRVGKFIYMVIVNYNKNSNLINIETIRDIYAKKLFFNGETDTYTIEKYDPINVEFVKKFNDRLVSKCPELSITVGYIYNINKKNDDDKSIKNIISYHYDIITDYDYNLIICLNKNDTCISSVIINYSDFHKTLPEGGIFEISSFTHEQEGRKNYNNLLVAFAILYFIINKDLNCRYIFSSAVNSVSAKMMINNFNGNIAGNRVIEKFEKTSNYDFEFVKTFEADYFDYKWVKKQFYTVTGPKNNAIDYIYSNKTIVVKTYTDLHDPKTLECANNVLDRLYGKTIAQDDKTLKC